jgi:hypothetical protein
VAVGALNSIHEEPGGVFLRSRVLNATLVCLSVLLTLAVGEVALRVSGAYRPPDEPVQTARPEIYRTHPQVGYAMWPSKTMTYRYPETSQELIPLVSNSDGFRTAREFDERDGRLRILVVGDSFVFGQGVRAEERVTEQLEAMESGWRVDNMGMTGWGLDLMVRAIERYGRKANPDIVVLAVYTDDFRRLLPYYAGVGFAYPKFELVGGELISVPFPYPRFWERLRLVQGIYQSRWQLHRNRYDLNQALLNRYLEDASEIGFDPVVVFFPGRADTEEDKTRRQFLARWTSSRGVPFADLTDPMQRAGADQVFIEDNWHWNALGHRVAAIELHNLLRRHFKTRPAP